MAPISNFVGANLVAGRAVLAGCVSCLALTVSSAVFAKTEPVYTPAEPAATQDGPASAAQTEPAAAKGASLEDIVVVAQKRSENLQKVPIAITAISPTRLETSGIKSTQDLAIAVPGLQLLNVASSLVPRVRGVGSTFNAAGIESPVVTFVGDVYHAFAADVQVDFADVEQVAVLKGPQGTLFGRNATGGVLQITTRQPDFDFAGSFQTSFDNYLTTRSNAFVTGGLSDDVAASLSVSYAHQGRGYGKNINTGNDTHRLDKDFTVRGKLHAFATDSTTIDITGDYNERRGSTSANFRIAPGRTAILPTPQPSSPWDSNQFLDPRQEFSGGGGSLKIEQDLGFSTLTSISAYRDGRIDYQFSAVPSALPARDNFVSYTSEQFTQELQLVSPSSGRFSWTVGAFFFYNDAGVDFQTALSGPFATAFSYQSVPTTQTTKSVAGFAQGTYELADTTRLTLGIRYTYDKKKFSGRVYRTTLAGNTILVSDVQNAEYSFSKPTWRIAIDHDFTPTILGYVSYNRGIKSGGFSTTSPTNPAFRPERLDAYEVGIKSQILDNSVRLNVGGFYYDYQNIQINAYTGSTPFVQNATSAKSYGVDAELQAQLTERLQINAGATWLHAHFGDFQNAQAAIPVTSGPLAGGTMAVVQDATGNTLPNSPSLTYSLGATYEIPVSFGTISFNANDNYNSGFYGEADNVLRQDSYHIVNASIGWKSSDENYSASLYVNNLLNEAVISQMASAPWGYIVDYSNPPRVIGASLKVKF